MSRSRFPGLLALLFVGAVSFAECGLEPAEPQVSRARARFFGGGRAWPTTDVGRYALGG